MRFGLDEDPVTGRLGAGLEIETAVAGTARNLSFHVVNRPAGTAQGGWIQAVRRPVKNLEPLDRVVTL
ncbi:hypothetical protein [Streptomyces sp. NPDC005283]|uniref:hypothetical protein n=1 Tax=Streptomyces sp. NPDC005283 TaxID=3156871 RepID=UPI0034569084